MAKKKAKAKVKKVRVPRTPEQTEKRKTVFRFFEKVVVGAVKFWLTVKGVQTPYIMAVDQVDEFIKSKIEEIQ